MFMSGWFRRLAVAAGLVLVMAGSALAQSATPPSASQPDGWKFTVYPVLAWVPTNIGIEVNVPTDGGGGGGGGGEGGGISGEIVDSRFDGAYLGGFSATNGTWRIDVDGLWAAVGGDRVDLPNLTVDVDFIYGHGSVGRSVYKDLYVTAGIRRIALKYDITIADVPPLTRKPGLWDPLVGIAYHRVGDKLELHGLLDVGGFGVGSDVEFGGSFRVDWKPVRHFGLTAGYTYLLLEFSHELAGKTLEAKQTLSGPVVGIGLYF
jgi:hypothetical protein